jgi:hypothetical protein
MELRVINISNAVGWSRLRPAALAMGILPMLVLTACSDSPTSDSPTGPAEATTSFDGVIASQTLSGSLSFSVASTALSVVRAPGAAVGSAAVRPAFAFVEGDVAVTGTLKLAGSSAIELTGTYNTSTHALSLAGGGYTFTGTFADGRIDGTFTSPSESGTFSVQPSSDTATIRNYCGTYSGSTDQGHFNIAVNSSAGTLSGAWSSESDGKTGGLSGTTSGNSVTVNVLEGGAPNGTVVNGTITETSVSGTFSGPESSGTVSGGACS